MQTKAIRDLFPLFKSKTPSGGACTCDLSTHGHHPQDGSKCDANGCGCEGETAMMLLAPGDPLRDTPEKCRRYAARIAELQAKNDEDSKAALELLGEAPVVTVVGGTADAASVALNFNKTVRAMIDKNIEATLRAGLPRPDAMIVHPSLLEEGNVAP